MVKYVSAQFLSSRLIEAGGDGLVAARHLWHYGYEPTVFYPKQSKNDLYQRLATQLKNLDIPFTEDFDGSLKTTDHVVDAIFGIAIQTPKMASVLIFLRVQLLRRGARSFQGYDHCYGE